MATVREDGGLVVVLSDGERVVVDREVGADVYEAFDLWTQTRPRGDWERAAWCHVETMAQEYLEAIDREDAEVEDVEWATTEDLITAANVVVERAKLGMQTALQPPRPHQVTREFEVFAVLIDGNFQTVRGEVDAAREVAGNFEDSRDRRGGSEVVSVVRAVLTFDPRDVQ